MAAGVDVVSFSGDKLLGGPQAGILVGRRELLDRLKSHPLTRAMRVDKMTLAALEATLRSYENGTAEQDIPTLAMLRISPEDLHAKAELLAGMLAQSGVPSHVAAAESQVGGGAVPTRICPPGQLSWRVTPSGGRRPCGPESGPSSAGFIWTGTFWMYAPYGRRTFPISCKERGR